jgi:2-dehydropantoate 2-reductase
MGEENKPRIAVLGAGAIGSTVGGLLARAGEDVTLIGRKAHVEAINAQGLRIDGIMGEFVVKVSAAEALDFRPDLVLLTVKTQDVEAICRQYQPHIQDTRIVTLQNGVRSDEIVASVLPKNNVISGVVVFNAQFFKPGQVTYALGGVLIVGEAFGRNGQRAEGIRARLNLAMQTRLSNNIRGAHWTKLLVNNLANGLEAMTGMSIRDCMHRGDLRSIGTAMLKEGYQTMATAGIKLEPLPGIPLSVMRLIIQAPPLLASAMLQLAMGSLQSVSSTLQSLRRGRPTEIDYLNGEIVRLGQKVGARTPYNSLVVALVGEVEKSHSFFAPDDLAHRFASLR